MTAATRTLAVQEHCQTSRKTEQQYKDLAHSSDSSDEDNKGTPTLPLNKQGNRDRTSKRKRKPRIRQSDHSRTLNQNHQAQTSNKETTAQIASTAINVPPGTRQQNWRNCRRRQTRHGYIIRLKRREAAKVINEKAAQSHLVTAIPQPRCQDTYNVETAVLQPRCQDTSNVVDQELNEEIFPFSMEEILHPPTSNNNKVISLIGTEPIKLTASTGHSQFKSNLATKTT